jgi:hypothetical protein
MPRPTTREQSAAGPSHEPGWLAGRFDVRPQRLAAPGTAHVEQFRPHPLEADAAELYGPSDGYIDSAVRVRRTRQSAGNKTGLRD